MANSVMSRVPNRNTQAYHCRLPDWNPLIASDVRFVIHANPFIAPSITWRSNQASGRDMLLKMIFLVTKR